MARKLAAIVAFALIALGACGDDAAPALEFRTDQGEVLTLDSTTVANARVSGTSIGFELTHDAARRFAKLTGRNVGRKIKLVLDGRTIMEPMVFEPMSGGTGVIGAASEAEARAIVEAMRR